MDAKLSTYGEEEDYGFISDAARVKAEVEDDLGQMLAYCQTQGLNSGLFRNYMSNTNGCEYGVSMVRI